MNKFKAAIIGFYTAIGMTEKAEALRASAEEKVLLTDADVEGFTAEVEAFKHKAEENATAAAELATAQEQLTAANLSITATAETLATVTSERDAAAADLVTANARIAELEAAAGVDPTDAGKKDEEPAASVPSWVDPEAAHNKMFKEMGIL